MASPTTTATPQSPARSRLRGLSYLRNYTHSHLHPRIDPSGSNRSPSPPLVTSPRSFEHSTHMADDEAGSNSMPARVSTGAWLPNGGLNGVSHTTATQDTVYAPDAWLPHVAAPSTVNANCDRVDGSLASPSTPRQSTPSLRFLPLVEQTPKGHPPLVFNPIYRTLPHPNHVIRIGRYSERDNTADQNSPTAQRGGSVGFKSKVVSRRHCEMFQSGSHWFLKDVKSSSGTFLNHVRLSPPGVESRPFPVQDGDQIQLGIDFRGGEEMIFRCVKIRMELNRGWQRSLNNFKYDDCASAGVRKSLMGICSTTAHKRLQDFRKQNRFQSDAGSTHSTECSICLNAVAVSIDIDLNLWKYVLANPVQPCQTLFVAPCSHTWHYKVRSIMFPRACHVILNHHFLLTPSR